MPEGLTIVVVGIVGVFANLLVLMVLIEGMGRVVRRVEAARAAAGAPAEDGKTDTP